MTAKLAQDWFLKYLQHFERFAGVIGGNRRLLDIVAEGNLCRYQCNLHQNFYCLYTKWQLNNYGIPLP